MSVPEENLPQDNRPIAYTEGTCAIYRASACGGCVRALAAARQGFGATEKPKVVADAAQAGHDLEPEIVGRIRAQGWSVEDRQRETEIHLPALTVRGHSDGTAWLVAGDPRRRLLEVKLLGKSRFDHYMRHGLAGMRDYAAQVRFYLEAFAPVYGPMDVLYAVGLREKDPSTGAPRIGTVVLREIANADVPVTWDEVKRKLLTAELFARKGILPPCDVEPGSSEAYFCGYKYLCDFPKAQVEVLPEEQAAAVREWGRAYLQAQAQAKAAEAAQAQARDRLIALLGTAKRIEGDGYRVTMSSGGSTSWDIPKLEAALAAAGLDAADFKVKKSWPRLLVKGPGEE